MFEKIKERLQEIEKMANRDENTREELNKILKGITEVKNEIERLEDKTKSLLGRDENIKEKKPRHTDMSGFLSKIQSARVNVETLLDRGWNYIVSGRYEKASRELLQAKKLSPKNVQIYNLLGWAYIHLEQYDKASLTFQEVLNLDSNNEMAHANLGYLNYKKGLYREAIEGLSNITKNANNKQAVLYALFYLGLIYQEREMFDDAIEFLNKAIALGPNLYEAYYYLGKAYKKRGLNNLATQIWEKLIDINKFNIWAKKAKEELNGK